MQLLDWVSAAFRTDLSVTIERQSPRPAGASGVIMSGSGNETALEARFSAVTWDRKLTFADCLARVREARPCGGAAFRERALAASRVMSSMTP
jgi:hypothetical protein